MLTVEFPGFDLEDIVVHWEDGVRASGASAGSQEGSCTSVGVLNASVEHFEAALDVVEPIDDGDEIAAPPAASGV